MYNIARITDEEREILFRNTADKKNMSEGIIEKDFWVTITLDYLFHRSRWKNPSFEELMKYIRELEEEINQLGSKGDYEV